MMIVAIAEDYCDSRRTLLLINETERMSRAVIAVPGSNGSNLAY